MAKHRAGKSSGSHRHTERMGPGPVAGAGMVAAGGPGPAARRVTPQMAGANFTGGANSYNAPGMKTYKEGQGV